jgi:hypothetical protein
MPSQPAPSYAAAYSRAIGRFASWARKEHPDIWRQYLDTELDRRPPAPKPTERELHKEAIDRELAQPDLTVEQRREIRRRRSPEQEERHQRYLRALARLEAKAAEDAAILARAAERRAMKARLYGPNVDTPRL